MKDHLLQDALLLSNKFHQFAESECKETSPLYYQLSSEIANDEDLLRLCSFVRKGQPVPNTFLAAVHFLILKNQSSPLARYYPSVTGEPTNAIAFNLFKEFALHNRAAIIELLKQRIVQTNVLTRCNYLLPVFSNILSLSEKPATIIDIGCSAGLNLNFDQYEYYYNNMKVYGDSKIKLQCVLKGNNTPLIKSFNNPIRKIGIDQNLVDLSDADDHTWLQALIWPDQTERFAMLKEALAVPTLPGIELIKGSTVNDFQQVIETVNPAETLIIYATHVLYQFPEKLLAEFYNMLDVVAKKRDFYFLSAEATNAVQLKHHVQHTAVILTTYRNNQKHETLVAETNGHGNWLKWK